MQICYNGVDITPSVQVESLMCLDDWGATPDSIDLMAADGGQWSRWKPQKGDTLEIRDKGWQSGPQAIDAISQRAGKIRLQALSLPKGGRTPHSQAWENLSLFAVGGELAARYGLGLSGGSDYHGMAKPGVELGRGKGGLRVTVALLDALKARRKRPVDDAPEVL